MCFKIKHTIPDRTDIHLLEKALFSTGLLDMSYFTPPFQADYANQVDVGNGVFANHDLKDLQIIKCKPVIIKKEACKYNS